MTPNSFKQGIGCAICSKKDPETTRIKFENIVMESGGRIVGEYINANTPVAIICIEDHQGNPIPNSVINCGQGICRGCSGRDPKVAEVKFIENIAKLGGTLIGKYVSAETPVEVLCPNGVHICTPTPHSINNGKGICFKCSHGQYNAEMEFTAKIIELGGKILSSYKDVDTPVVVICKKWSYMLCNSSKCEIRVFFLPCV
jgi:hypothetical protein